MDHVRAEITGEPLDPAALIAEVEDPACGGIAVFVGVVRQSSAAPAHDEPVIRLEYEAHPELAASRIDDIAREAGERWTLTRIVAVHRTGICALGEPTVVIACSSAHRAEALDACRWTIDEVKRSVPIWKREVFEGGASWVEVG